MGPGNCAQQLYLALVTAAIFATTASTDSKPVRLVHGGTTHEGRVEMYIEDHGGWLPVLYYRSSITGGVPSWNSLAADILCRELGYPEALSSGVENNALWEDSRRRITDVRCREEDTSLLDCDFEFSSQIYFKAAATAKCKYINCGYPGEVENADSIGTEYSYNSLVQYICHDGYYVSGDDVISCTSEGKWTVKPSCILNETEMAETESTSGDGVIIGIGVVIGAVIVIALVVMIICIYRRKLASICRKDPQHNHAAVQVELEKSNQDVLSVRVRDSTHGAAYDDRRDSGDRPRETGSVVYAYAYTDIENIENAHREEDRRMNPLWSSGGYRDKRRTQNGQDMNYSADYNSTIYEQPGGNFATDDSGTVENIAYESANVDDDTEDVYTEIDDYRDSRCVMDNTPYESVANSDGNGQQESENVSERAFLSPPNSASSNAPVYFVLEDQ